MGVGLEAVSGGDIVGSVELGDDADAAAAMDIGGDGALIPGEAADLDVLADGLDVLLEQVVHGLVAVGLAGQQSLHVRGVLGDDHVGAGVDKSLELSVLSHEVGLGVDLDDHGHLAAVRDLGEGHALGGNTAGLLLGGSQALLPQEINSLVHVAVTLGEGLLAIHHAAAGHFPELGNVLGGETHLATILSFRFDFPGNHSSAGASSSASAGSSSRAAAPIWPSRPSMMASAMAPAMSFTARMASSLPGMT